jgi:phospholipase C
MWRGLGAAAAVALAGGVLSAGSAGAEGSTDKVNHIVVIYQENHSFDNLFGKWGPVNGQELNGLSESEPENAIQVSQDGKPYTCLPQNDVNLAPVASACTSPTSSPPGTGFPNAPFPIDKYISATDKTCPKPGTFVANGVKNADGDPGGCTRDLVHRFYQEQYQINGGEQNRYVTGSDAIGLAMGYYDTTKLPMYKYLHQPGAPNYVVADNFFQAAFGGSFINHQYLVAAAAPVWNGALNDGSADDLHSILDANAMPNNYPLYRATGTVKDGALSQSCVSADVNTDAVCGDFVLNTIQPTYQPFAPGTAAARKLPPIENKTSSMTIGDLLSDAGVDWAWYSGGWDNAAGNVGGAGWTNGAAAMPTATNPAGCADPMADAKATWPYCGDKLFQYHHQPFNYFARYAPGTPDRAKHLKDEADLFSRTSSGTLTQKGNLKPVTFIKPIGAENEHPGYASTTNGQSHLEELVKAIMSGPNAKDTMIVATYDEFGGSWDHVPPPGPGSEDPHDPFGPGTRIPALVISQALPVSGVDHTEHDTVSILSTIERRFYLPPLAGRDAWGNDLFSAFHVKEG